MIIYTPLMDMKLCVHGVGHACIFVEDFGIKQVSHLRS